MLSVERTRYVKGMRRKWECGGDTTHSALEEEEPQTGSAADRPPSPGPQGECDLSTAQQNPRGASCPLVPCSLPPLLPQVESIGISHACSLERLLYTSHERGTELEDTGLAPKKFRLGRN